jgi:hypothetical protein
LSTGALWPPPARCIVTPEQRAQIPPMAFLNPHLCTMVMADVVVHWARERWYRSRRRGEARLLERIPVLPEGWDAAGRHALRPQSELTPRPQWRAAGH